jgi:hypothetical protein
LALNLRLAELRMEMERTQLRVIQLETEIQDSQLATLFGEANRNPGTLGPQLNATRLELDSQKELIRRVRSSQQETQVRYLLERRREEVESRRPLEEPSRNGERAAGAEGWPRAAADELPN